MNVLSLFTGVGGFDLGFERAGMTVVAQAEINKYASAVLGLQYNMFGQRVPNLGDVRNAIGYSNPIDVICGGFPCQNVSLAGNREGLRGERSGEWFAFADVIKSIRSKWVVIENVPGLLSSNGGKDFATVVQALEEFGYGVAWRVLDSQYFGVPQRRRRVFIVGYLGDGTRAAEVLFESACMPRDHKPSKKAGEEVARPLIASSGSSNKHDHTTETYITQQFGHWENGRTGATLGARDAKQSRNLALTRAVAIDTRNHRVQPAGISGTIQAKPNGGMSLNYINPIAVDWQASHTTDTIISDKPGLKANRTQAIAFDRSNITSKHNRSNPQPGDPSPTLARSSGPTHIAANYQVRRLTPKECERLQGFPDGWTRRGIMDRRLVNISDSQRYKQLGNAVTVNVAEWIGRRIRSSTSN